MNAGGRWGREKEGAWSLDEGRGLESEGRREATYFGLKKTLGGQCLGAE